MISEVNHQTETTESHLPISTFSCDDGREDQILHPDYVEDFVVF